MLSAEYLAVIVGMGIVTYVPRWLPLVLLTRRRLPLWLVEWLDFIPASILSALVVPYLITTGDPRHLDILRPELFVAVPTFAFALVTKSLAGTVVVGMFLFWLAGIYL
ncbi:MAG TPA: AzlD domain-containing protein [Deltaproteobacteria bacterium]|nr:AzlD domain-containing protein [Deltaproteobacteria bacterium]